MSVLILAATAKSEKRFIEEIDPDKQYQTIEYFAASDCWTMQKIGGWSGDNRDKVARLLFSTEEGIGLSGWRLNLGGGIDHSRIINDWHTVDTFEVSQGIYDWTRCENARWFLRAAKANGVSSFIAFCNSPPRRLTLNGLTVADPDRKITTNLRQGMEEQYGEYIADILAHFRDNPVTAERIDFDWVSPINEPQWDWTTKQEGTRAANGDILREYKSIYEKLRSQHLNTKLLGPESGSIPDMYQPNRGASSKYGGDFGDYITLLCSKSSGDMLNRTICYHSYWSDDPDHLIADRVKLRQRLDRFPQWKAAETEYCIMEPGRDLSMKTAIRAMRILHCDLSIVNAVCWSWWLAISNGNYKDGLLYTDWKHAGDVENIIPSKTFWALGNYSRFVRPGSIRVGIQSKASIEDVQGVMGTAYLLPGSHLVAAVYINSSDETVLLNLSVLHHDGVKWIPYITSDAVNENLRPSQPFPDSDAYRLPGQSIVTFVETRQVEPSVPR